MKCARFALGVLFIGNKYPLLQQWPALGLSIYMAQVYSNDVLRQNLINSEGEIAMPSFSQINEQMANGELTSRSSPIAAYIYADFLVSNWRWDKTLAILNDYASFEKIIGISEEEFQRKCSQYYQSILITCQE